MNTTKDNLMNKQLLTGISIMFIIMGYQWTIATRMGDRMDGLHNMLESMENRNCEQEKDIVRLECRCED